MKPILTGLSLLVVSLALTGCATLFTGTSDTLTFNSEPEGAKIRIDGIDYGRTPATISLKRPGLNDKQVSLELDGYETRIFTLQKEFNPVSILNLFGILGWAIDVVSGSIMKYNPRVYNMELEPETGAYNLEDLERDKQGRFILPDSDAPVTIWDAQNGLNLIFE